jgi:hypothetical protein
MKISKILLTAAFMFVFAAVYAEIVENTPENQFDQSIITKTAEVSTLVNDGIKSIRQEVVSSTHQTDTNTTLNNGLNEHESGSEDVTSKDILYYEPKEEIYEAREAMDDIIVWLTMYRTTVGDDLVTYKKMKGFLEAKSKALDKIINALKYEKDNKDSVMKYKLEIKRCDKDFDRYLAKLKGKILLIIGKPLPEPTKEKD